MQYAATQFAYTNRLPLHICISECTYSLYKPIPNISCAEKKDLQMPIYHPMQQAKGSLEYTLTAVKWGLCFLILKQWCIKLCLKFHSSLFHSKFSPYPSNITTIKCDQIYFFFVKHGGNITVCAVWNVERCMQNTYVYHSSVWNNQNLAFKKRSIQDSSTADVPQLLFCAYISQFAFPLSSAVPVQPHLTFPWMTHAGW